MYHGLAEASGNSVQDGIDEVIVRHLGIDIKSIHIVQVFSDIRCLFVIANFTKSSFWLIVVSIVLPDSIVKLFPVSITVSIYFPSFQCLSFCILTHVCQTLVPIMSLSDVEVIIHLKDPFLKVLQLNPEFGRQWWLTTCYFQLIASLYQLWLGQSDIIGKA